MIVCPCCGHETNVSQVDIGRLSQARLPIVQRRIVAVLAQRFPNGITVVGLVDALYGDRQDGGPAWAESSVKVCIHRLRKRLPELGWSIPKETSGRGNTAVYRLKMLVKRS